MRKGKLYFDTKEPLLDVCTWAWNICNLPAGESCLVKDKTFHCTDIVEWKEAAQSAQRCKNLGERLTKRQYERRRLGKVI